MNRRDFLTTSTASAFASISSLAATGKAPRIVLRSSWQTVNIGDIGHTPGVLGLIEKHIPQAEVTLWPMDVKNGVEEMLRKRFPKLNIVKTKEEAFTNDFLLHGSGPYLTAHRDVAAWKQETGKPYGIYGITMAAAGDPGLKIMRNNGLDEYCKAILDTASFVFLRDGMSLKVVKDAGVKAPIIEYGPDGAFGADVRNDAAAISFLKQHGLEEGKYMCFLPNLRNAPYWKVKPNYAFDEIKHQRNEEMKEHDHAPLRDAIIAITREAGMKVLICPEDSTQMESGKELLYDPLPDDVKAKVVWRENFWLTDEAISTYVRSAGLVSNEMHSPIMALGNGIPAIVCRFVEQTTKGFMWRDIGLGDWLFDLDKPEELARVAPTALAIAMDPAAAKAKAAKARAFVQQRQHETMEILAQACQPA
ncbi:polysaccharide pyruvyl transferase family protein [Brevifollis gellanilyticus]|uniref:Polysaccharide pyruvyl transferase n=1 Tax=Brevifollis gellanilyticus TaxID=748831 RepID=A0A512MCQ9_9BACT|nr:polysaccharide pyruvyl transferase family protein [Brevifollis gellanilyticus]GEP44509.1 polysaccharide pyruvyl transferase [Brevifollis gellanilyticus]